MLTAYRHTDSILARPYEKTASKPELEALAQSTAETPSDPLKGGKPAVRRLGPSLIATRTAWRGLAVPV